MVWEDRRACALFISFSLGALMSVSLASSTGAQTGPESQQQALPPVTVEAPVEKRRTAAKPRPARKPVRTARRHTAPEKPPAPHEPSTDVATKTVEPVINTLAAVSVLRQEQIEQAMPGRLSDIFNGMPSVWFADRPDDPGSSINVRGLQDFGRVAVLVDGASQDFQRSGHFANGQFYVDPELLAGADVVRGPVANIYGSGAIGGVTSFRTKDLDDILLPGETQAIQSHAMFGTNGDQWLASTFGGARGPLGDIFVGGIYRDSGNYTSGAGTLSSFQCAANCAGYPLTVIPGSFVFPTPEMKPNPAWSSLPRVPATDSRSSSPPSPTIPATTSEVRPARGLRSRGLACMARTSTIRPLPPNTLQKSRRPRSSTFKTNVYWNQTDVKRRSKSPMSKTVLTFPDRPGPQATTCSIPPGLQRQQHVSLRHRPVSADVTYGGDFNNDR